MGTPLRRKTPLASKCLITLAYKTNGSDQYSLKGIFRVNLCQLVRV